MSWADALSALVALGDKPAAIVRVDTTERTLQIQNTGDGWRIVEDSHRLRSD